MGGPIISGLVGNLVDVHHNVTSYYGILHIASIMDGFV